jgi:hypothetical protein
VRQVNGLSQASFETDIFPILRSTCAAACHQAIGSSASATPPGTSFRNNRFVLTGDPEGDYNVTLTMITDTCNAASNALLKKPSTAPHPLGAVVGTPPVPSTVPVLVPGSANYNAISSWISKGC